MKRIGKTSWKRLVPAFAAAALAIGAMAAAPAHAQSDPCTKEMAGRLSVIENNQLVPTNVAVAAQADGKFEVTWNNPSGREIPSGAVVGYCVDKKHPGSGGANIVCGYAQSLGIPPSVSSLTSATLDSCYGPNADIRPPCHGGTHEFRVRVEPACPFVGNPYSGSVSAESTLDGS